MVAIVINRQGTGSASWEVRFLGVMSNPRTPSKSSFSSAAFGGQEVLLPLRVRTNPPPPDQWTRVREYSIEERDAYEVVSHAIIILQHLCCDDHALSFSCFSFITRTGNMEYQRSYNV